MPNDSEQDKIERSRRQLLTIGVICITVVITIIWLTGLRRQFEYNKKQYPSATESFTGIRSILGKDWREFQGRLDALK